MWFSAWVGDWGTKAGCAGPAGRARAAEVPDLCPGRYLASSFLHTHSFMYTHNFVAHLLCVHLCLDSQVESLGSCVKPLEGLTPNLSHYSITKVAAGGPRAEGSSGATLGGAEKGTAGPSRPGAGTGPSPNTNRTTKMQCCQWPSPRAAE